MLGMFTLHGSKSGTKASWRWMVRCRFWFTNFFTRDILLSSFYTMLHIYLSCQKATTAFLGRTKQTKKSKPGALFSKIFYSPLKMIWIEKQLIMVCTRNIYDNNDNNDKIISEDSPCIREHLQCFIHPSSHNCDKICLNLTLLYAVYKWEYKSTHSSRQWYISLGQGCVCVCQVRMWILPMISLTTKGLF